MELRVFESEEFGKVRTEEIDGKVWFCGNDVAMALGYKNTRKALKDHCRWCNDSLHHPKSQDGNAVSEGCIILAVTDELGRTYQTKFIDEGNVYRLITHSKLPGAEKFEAWVFDEVLPQIRRTGSYGSSSNEEILRSVIEAISILTRQVGELWEFAFKSGAREKGIGEKIEDAYLTSSVRSRRAPQSAISRLPLKEIGEVIKWIESGTVTYKQMQEMSRKWCSKGRGLLPDREYINYAVFFRFKMNIRMMTRKGNTIEVMFRDDSVISVCGDKVSRIRK